MFSHSVMLTSLWPPWSAAHQAPLSMGILQAKILEWLAMPSSRGSSKPRDQTQVSCTAGRFFTVWATRKASRLGAIYCQQKLNTMAQRWEVRGYLVRFLVLSASLGPSVNWSLISSPNKVLWQKLLEQRIYIYIYIYIYTYEITSYICIYNL